LKKGEFKAKRLAHKRKQFVYDAVKRCREMGEAFVTFAGMRLRLSRVTATTDLPELALVKARGRIRLVQLTWKDGVRARFLDEPFGSVSFPEENVLCAVTVLDENRGNSHAQT
jgi:hypothetical protein